METTQTGSLMDRLDSMCADHVDDSVLQISGAGHWFLEGWIGDHSVEFLVDSGSSVTAMADSLYQTLVRTGAPMGALGCTSRTLRGEKNGTRIGVSGCSHCVGVIHGTTDGVSHRYQEPAYYLQTGVSHCSYIG